MASRLIVKELSLNEFRGIRKIKKPIRLSRFTVIIGRNNSGKTAVLEALYLLLAPFGASIDPIFGVSRADIIASRHSGTSSLVYGYSGEATLRCSLGVRRQLGIEVRVRPQGIHKVSIDGKEVSLEEFVIKLGEALRIKPEERSPEWLSRLSILFPGNKGFLEKLRSLLTQEHAENEFVKRGLHSKIVRELVNPVVHDRFTEFFVKDRSLKLRKSFGTRKLGPLYIDIRDLGEGVKRLILQALAIEYLDPVLILWDDIETAAHPGLIEKLLGWLASSKRQVVLATHSIDVLYHLAFIKPEGGQVLLLSKDENDVLTYKSFNMDKLEDMLDSGLDPRKLAEVLGL